MQERVLYVNDLMVLSNGRSHNVGDMYNEHGEAEYCIRNKTGNVCVT
jgi:hypothetical protein